MISIIFETHSTTVDNEAHLSSGWFDAELSALGQKQARQLGERRKAEDFDAVFCSDLQRAYKTAEIAFVGRAVPIIRDARLRECNYGDLTRHAESEVTGKRAEYVSKPFPNGESYEQAVQRVKSFLQGLLENYDGKKVLIIGHKATQYGLEHWINKKQLPEIIGASWAWQPGWEYNVEKLS